MRTYRQLIAELEKFKNQDEPACIMAFTDPDCPDEGDNYIDCSGVLNIRRYDNELHIICSDNGTMTWDECISCIYHGGFNFDAIANIKIGYGLSFNDTDLYSWNDEPIESRRVVDCTVLPEDTIWNLRLETL